MKIALIADTHWGVRSDNIAFLDMNKKFLDNIFFPLIDTMGIDTVIHLGDLVDRRKYINIQTANRLRMDFIQPIKDRKIKYHQILGNHDVYYKNTNGINSFNELYGTQFCMYQDTTEIKIGDLPILFVPWINQSNKDQSLEVIKKSNSKVCMGHLEIEGFEMFRGSVATHGEDRLLFDRFHSTFSGHFHHRSTDGSIYYLGSHGQFTWSDYGDERGFHIFDTETLEVTFIKNPYNMFSKIFYDDKDKTNDKVLDQDFSQFAGTYGKLIVKNKENPYWFDLFCNKIEKAGLIDYQIVEDHHNLNIEDDTEITSETQSTVDIFKRYISYSTWNSNVNIEKLEQTIVSLYNEAAAFSEV